MYFLILHLNLNRLTWELQTLQVHVSQTVEGSGQHLLDFFCSGIQFYVYFVLLSLYLCFISFLDLVLYVLVLGDGTWISLGSFMPIKHLCVLIHI